jgi:1-acyl-sn-glycerol-3-phosphate acyltransferase
MLEAMQAEPAVASNAWTRWKPIRRVRAVVQQGLVFPLLASFCRLTVRGTEQLRDLRGPAVFVANHTTSLDGLVILKALPRRFRVRCAVVAALDAIFTKPLLGTLARLVANAVPISREGGARPTLEMLKQVLADGWSVVIFPEGRMSKSGHIGEFRKGAAILAADAGVAVVPAYMDGLPAILPRGHKMPKPGAAAVTFGAPLRPGAGESYEQFIARIEAAVRELAGPAGVPRDAPVPSGERLAEGSSYWGY